MYDIQELFATLKQLIIATESALEDPEGISVSDIEQALYEARGDYYKFTGVSVEGEK